MPKGKAQQAELKSINEDRFITRWAGFATTKRPYQMTKNRSLLLTQYAQRSGEKQEYDFKGFFPLAMETRLRI